MSEKLATFKIDEQTWQQFKARTGNASVALKKMIELYLSDRLDLEADQVSPDEAARLWAAVRDLSDRLGKSKPAA